MFISKQQADKRRLTEMSFHKMMSIKSIMEFKKIGYFKVAIGFSISAAEPRVKL